MTQRTRNILLTALALPIFAYCTYRAASLSLVHDEALSYAIATMGGTSIWSYTTNNHILNTFLMGLSIKILGPSEFALRLPNLIALIPYLTFTFLILKRLSSPTAWAIGFSIAILNPFLLDFFSLARGYGMALSFTVASLYFLIKTREELTPFTDGTGISKKAMNNLVASSCMAWLAVASMFAYTYFYMGILIATIMILATYHRKKHLKMTKGDIESYIVLTIMNGIFDAVVCYRLMSMAKYAPQVGLDLTREYTTVVGPWKHTGFWESTVASIIDATLYGTHYPDIISTIALRLVAATVVIATYAALRPLFGKKTKTNLYICGGILLVMALQPIIARLVASFPFPIQRTALMYVPIYAFAIAFATDTLMAESTKFFLRLTVQTIMVVIIAAIVLNFAKTANSDHTYIWKYDANTHRALQSIEKTLSHIPHDGKITVGTTLQFEPSINYYANTVYSKWLTPVTRTSIKDPTMDFYYCMQADSSQIPLEKVYTVRKFDDTGTVLYRNEKEGFAPQSHRKETDRR